MKEAFNTSFAIKGLRIDHEDLNDVAYSLVKEGDAYEREIGDFLLDWSSDNPTIVLRTSGSTAPPREVTIDKEAMIQSALRTGQYLNLNTGTKALLCLAANSIAGKMMLVRAMVLGWDLDFVPPSSRPLENLQQQVDFAAMVPLQLYNSLHNLKGVSKILVGGAPLSRKLLSLIPVGGVSIYQSYGMTETASHIALRELKPVALSEFPERVLDPFNALEGIQLSKDERGCLVIDAPFVSGSPIVTNDLVELESPTRFRWLGRADNVINSGGVKLIPEQLEAKLGPLIPGPFILAGVPDDALGEKLVLVIEGGSPGKNLLEQIKASGNLGKFEIPREVCSLPLFTETENGKLNRPEILKQLLSV